MLFLLIVIWMILWKPGIGTNLGKPRFMGTNLANYFLKTHLKQYFSCALPDFETIDMAGLRFFS